MTSLLSGALLLLAVLLGAPRPAAAQVQTISTDHFRIHFMPGTEGTARRVAEVAEEVFDPLATAYDYYDEFSPIHIVVLDNSDVLGNGSASYYSNTIYIWATALDFELRGDHDWIKDVVTHELTHIMTLNRARQPWPFQFALISVSRFDANPDISFDLPLFHLNTPDWWNEGVAQFADEKFGYDTWDTHRDMLLRMASLEDDLLSYEEMGSLSNRTGAYYGEMVYNQGFGLMLYIRDQYGRDKAEALTRHSGAVSFDSAIRQALGISADQLYTDWARYLKDRYGQLASQVHNQGFFEGEKLKEQDEGTIEYHPALSPDGKKLAFLTSEKRDYPILRMAILDLETGKRKVLDPYVDTRLSWSPDSRQLLYVRNKEGFNDLYLYDLAADKEQRISARLRAKDPSFSPDGRQIVFIHNEDGTNNIGLLDRQTTRRSFLTNNQDATQYSSPRFSPDGKWVLFSVFRGQDRDVALIRADSPPRPREYGLRDRQQAKVPDSLKVFPDSLAFPHPDTSGFRVLLGSGADERDPCWLPDGSGFVFSSDQSGVFNLYRYNLEDGRVDQLTNVLGGAFVPAVSVEGQVVYAGYHANNYSLYRFSLGAYQREARFEPVALRDYQGNPKLPKLADEFKVGHYSGRRQVSYIPILQVGPAFIGNTFGLNQFSAGVQFSTGEQLGGDEFTAWGVVGKNMRQDTDLNTDFGVYYQRSLLPMSGNNRSFNPSAYVGIRRREIDNLIRNQQTLADTVLPAETLVSPLDSTRFLLIPESQRYLKRYESRQDLFKTVLQNLAVGVELPLTRRQEFSFQYLNRNYEESWTLRSLRQQSGIFLVQETNGQRFDITDLLPEDLAFQDTAVVDPQHSLSFYDGLRFFSAHDLSFAWSYLNLKPTSDRYLTPQGRALTLLYRYSLATVADSLAQLISTDGTPRDALGPASRHFRVNEYVGSYVEYLGLPFNNVVSLQLIGAYRNLKLKPSFDPEAGFFEGRYYWPLRYYLGGHNFLSGYPYFSASGTKLVYGRLGYAFPLSRRLSSRFLNLTFAKCYAEFFAEAGAVGNFSKARWGELDTKDFLSDLGAELRMQVLTFYRIPMTAFFQVARPLNRNRVLREPDEPRIDKWRYYCGLTL
ncbi:MAG: PD40 domain-containing protein [Candidatus Handelsmanbacteria bacterium]|nr:PD40 domain-containing protein [Candidatus Handelsmanbacteria bacterium]